MQHQMIMNEVFGLNDCLLSESQQSDWTKNVCNLCHSNHHVTHKTH